MQKAEYQAICHQIKELDSQDRKLRDQQSASYREQSELQAQYGIERTIDYLLLTIRIFRRLNQAGIYTMDQLLWAVLFAEPGAPVIGGLGKKSMEDIRTALQEFDYRPESRQAIEEARQRFAVLQALDADLAEKRAAIKAEQDRLAKLIGYNYPLETLGLKARVLKPLIASGFTTITELSLMLMDGGPETLMRIPRLGAESRDTLMRRLQETNYLPEGL